MPVCEKCKSLSTKAVFTNPDYKNSPHNDFDDDIDLFYATVLESCIQEAIKNGYKVLVNDELFEDYSMMKLVDKLLIYPIINVCVVKNDQKLKMTEICAVGENHLNVKLLSGILNFIHVE